MKIEPEDYENFLEDYTHRYELGWDALRKHYGEGTDNAYRHWYRKIRDALNQQEDNLQKSHPDDEILADNYKTTVRSKLATTVAKREAEALAKTQILYEDILEAVHEVFVADPMPNIIHEHTKRHTPPVGRLITPVLFISDLHSGANYKTTEGLSHFNPSVFDQRIRQLSEEVQRITRMIQKFDTTDKLIICWGGDYIDGRNIFPGQHDETIALIYQFRYAIRSLYHDLITKLAPLYEEIVMVTVDGNHGRIGDNSVRMPKVMDSLDTLFLDMLQLQCQELNNIWWDKAEHEFKLFTVHGWNFLLQHGHRNKGMTHTPTTGARNRKRDMESMLHRKIDVTLSGHFHSPGLSMDGFSYNICNGSLPGGSPYGESLGFFNPPIQVMFTISEQCPVESYYPILLSDRDECYTLDIANY